MIDSDAVQSSGDVMRRLADLERKVRELEAGRRLEAATIGRGGLTIRDTGGVTIRDGGGVTVRDGGDLNVEGGELRVRDTNGAERLYFGPLNYSGAAPGVGWLFRRHSGGIAFSLEGSNRDNQFVAIRDEAGSIVVSDDAAAGQGLATPYIPLQAVPTSWHASRQQTTTSGTFTPLWTVTGARQHPRLRVYLMVQCDAGVSAEIRVHDPSTSTVIAGPTTTAAGAFTYVTLTGALPAGAHLAQIKLDVEMRVASGAGTVGTSLIYALGVQS